MARGWTVKAVHGRLLNPAVYRHSSAFRADAFQADPDNRLLWRFRLRRLDAEALRDAMLRVAGEPDAKEGGPFVPTNHTEDNSVEADDKLAGARRRSSSLQPRRTQAPPLLEGFEQPPVRTDAT